MLEFFTEKTPFWALIKITKIVISATIVLLVAFDSRESSRIQTALERQVLESTSFPVVHFHQSRWDQKSLEFIVDARAGPLENLFVEIQDSAKFFELRHLVWYENASPEILSNAGIRKEIPLVPANEGVSIGTLPLRISPEQIGLTYTFTVRTRKGTYWGKLGALHNGERWTEATEIYLNGQRIYHMAWDGYPTNSEGEPNLDEASRPPYPMRRPVVPGQ